MRAWPIISTRTRMQSCNFLWVVIRACRAWVDKMTEKNPFVRSSARKIRSRQSCTARTGVKETAPGRELRAALPRAKSRYVQEGRILYCTQEGGGCRNGRVSLTHKDTHQCSRFLHNACVYLFLIIHVFMHARSRKSYVYFKSMTFFPFFFVLHYAKSPLRGISTDLRIVKPYTTGRARARRVQRCMVLLSVDQKEKS